MIKAAVIGYGYWGPNIVRNLFENPDIQLKTVCDLSPQRLRRVCKRYPGVSTTTDHREIMTDRSIDLVAIVTPVKSHVSLGLAALKAGKNVLLAKPMAASESECLELIEQANKSKKLLMVDHTFVYHPAVQAIKKMVEAKELGDLLYYNSSRMNLGLYQPDVSVIYDLMPHDLSILNEWIPEDPIELSVTAKHAAGLPQPDIALMQLNYQSNFIASIHASWLSPSKIRETTITGSRKMVVYNEVDVIQRVKIFDKGVQALESTNREQAYTDYLQYRHGDVHSPAIDQSEALKLEIEHLVDCLEEGCNPRTDGYQGMRVVRLLEYADRMARANQCWVTIPEAPTQKSGTTTNRKKKPDLSV